MTDKLFEFYEPVNNPTGLSGVVGGRISTKVLGNKIGDLFTQMPVSSSNEVNQYRKIWIKQLDSAVYTNLSVSLANVEHSDQVSFWIPPRRAHNTTINSPLLPPTGETGFSGDYSTSLSTGSYSRKGTTIPVWLRQRIPQDAGDDSLASFTLQIRAYKL